MTTPYDQHNSDQADSDQHDGDQHNADQPLAGTQCPACETICIYQPPEDAAAMGITTVDIACHACSHIFETALPDVAPEFSAPPKDTPLDQATSAESKARAKKSGQSSGGRLKRMGMLLAATCLGSAVIIGTGIYLNPPVEQRSLEEQFKSRSLEKSASKPAAAPKEKPAAPPAAAATENPEQPAPQVQPQPPKQDIKVPMTPAVFASHHAGFTLAENDFGQVMTINFSVSNDGGSPGLPQEVTVYLIDAQGQIAMSWPMDTGQRPYEKGETRSFTTEVLEPPENITAVEVNVN